MKKFLLTIFFFCLCLILSGRDTEYGLHIQTWPHPSSEFTSLALENGEPIKAGNKETTMDFKLWNRNENVFGVVFRIITDQNKTLDLMYSVDENDKRFANLILNNKVYPLNNEIRLDCWIDVSLNINPDKQQISLTYDGETISIDAAEILPVHDMRIYFGRCPVLQYDLDNVASINLKDISISQNEKTIREWNMRLHQGDTCYDSQNDRPATTSNGRWLLDEHLIWRLIHKAEFNGTPSIAFDPASATFYMANDGKSLHSFRCTDRKAEITEVKGGQFAAAYPNCMYFIPETGRLMSYNLDQNIYSYFDFKSNTWTGRKAPEKRHKEYYWNNTVTWNPADSSLISFGGYGHYQFNHELLISHPGSTMPQKRVHLKEIDPRYAPASVLVDSILYVFGGRGCPSGKQEMTQKNYYDLYAIDIHSMQVTRLWEYEGRPADGDFLPGSNMIYDNENDCFYVFTSQGGGSMMRINRSEPGIDLTSYPVYQYLDAQHLYTNIHQSGDKFYGVFQQTQVEGNSQVYIYEIDSPPFVLKNGLTVEETPEETEGDASQKSMIPIYIAIAVLAAAYFIYRRRNPAITSKTVQTVKEPETQVQTPEEKPADHYDFSRKSICFFGGFRVHDKDGEDITALFTPTLKSLLIILILHTVKDEKGISGNRLIQILWFDKTEESAKNNRNVYMSKLRNIIERIGDVKIVNQKGFWSICFDDDTTCDYMEAKRLFAEKTDSGENLDRLMELLLRGAMLPNLEDDWVDPFKNDFSNNTIDFLTGLLRSSDYSDDFRLRIADTLFLHDFINEEALKVKCGILYRQGKKGLAKTVYNAFCKDYQSSLGTSFPVSMIDLIDQK